MPILNFKFSCQRDEVSQEILNFVPKEGKVTGNF